MKKSKGKSVKPAKKKRPGKSKKPVDLVEVRKDIANIVHHEAAELTHAVVEEGRKGQLAPVRYLFEMAGVYPAPEASRADPEEASLAKTLLHRLGVPDVPVVRDDDGPQTPVNPAVLKPGGDDARDPESAASQPETHNQAGKEANGDDDVPLLAGSIP